MGGGSDVLGFDDQRSTDHDWGPRVDLFFSAADYQEVGDRIYDVLSNKLPFTFKGYSTHFVDDYLMGDRNEYPIIHGHARSRLTPTSPIIWALTP